jgi:hypothetical protein
LVRSDAVGNELRKLKDKPDRRRGRAQELVAMDGYSCVVMLSRCLMERWKIVVPTGARQEVLEKRSKILGKRGERSQIWI